MNPGYSSFQESWGKSMASVLTQVTAQTWTAEPAEAVENAGPLVHIGLELSKGLSGEVRFSLSNAHALLLAGAFMGEKPEEEWSSAGQETVEEFVRQCAGYVMTDIKESHGEVSFATRPVSTDLRNRIPCYIRLSSASAEALLCLQFSEPLLALLDPEKAPATSTAQVRNLDLLMDVELPVTLRFGERVMALREILELQSGSVIELDRQVQEPVDLLLNGSVIARGNVVVVDGNYGLRVSEVAHTMAGALA